MAYIGKKPADIIATAVDTTTGTFSGDLTVDTNTLYVDSSTNSVGIGTITPNTTNLNSGTTSGIVVKSGGVAKNNFVALPSTGGSQWDVRESGGSGGEFTMRMFDTSGTHNVQISSNGNHFFNGGNVGIGTSSPDRTLVVKTADGSGIGIENAAGNQYRWAVTSDDAFTAIDSGTAERMRIDSSGNLLVGKTATNISNSGVELRSTGEIVAVRNNNVFDINRTSTDGSIMQFRKDDTAIGSIGSEGGDALYIGSGDTGIKFSSADIVQPFNPSTNSARDAGIDLGSSGARFKDLYLSSAARALEFVGVNDSDTGMRVNDTNIIKFITANGERARIDSIGNLLVGLTGESLWETTAGCSLRPNGTATFTRDSNPALLVNLLGSDANLINFYKNNSIVGSIGVGSGVLAIAGPSGNGLSFPNNQVLPATSTAGGRDNTTDLGQQYIRFKDLYLSGGVYLGGTGSANKLDDYEEGTWSPALEDYGGTPTFADAHYTKIGRVVHASVKVLLDGSSDPSGFKISGLPFTSLNTTNSLFGGYVSYTSSTFTNNIYVFVNSNDTDLRLYTTSGNSVSYNDIGANKEIRLVAIYFTA